VAAFYRKEQYITLFEQYFSKLVINRKASQQSKTRRLQIVSCCGSKKCRKSYSKFGGVGGIENHRERWQELYVYHCDLL